MADPIIRGATQDVCVARDVAERYVKCSNAGDPDGMADLFAEDAVFIPSAPWLPLQGRESLRNHYRSHISPLKSRITAATYYCDGNSCVMEFDVLTGTGETKTVVDIFTVNDAGEITRLAVYMREPVVLAD